MANSKFSTAANTNSTTGYTSGQNKTSTSLSTNILIYVDTPNGSLPIGAIQEMSIKENRDVKMIHEVGTDGNISAVPTSAVSVSGSCNRIRYDAVRATEAFGRAYLHLASQIYPFDIVILDKNRRDGNQVATIIKDVWFTDSDVRYTSDNWIITDNVLFKATRVYSFLVGTGGSAAVGGDLGIIPSGPFNTSVNDIERVVDAGKAGRLGSLDSGGLLDLVDFSTNVF